MKWLPDDVILLVLEILSASPVELYAPLICSHVCARWRQITINTPLLWYYINTSRGEALTRLWLTRSKEVLLHIRLAGLPGILELTALLESFLIYKQDHYNFEGNSRVLRDIVAQSHRWRSLEIAFSAIGQIKRALALLEQQDTTLYLDCLSIGPVGGSTSLLIDESVRSRQNDPHTALAPVGGPLARFRNINIQCKALRIDTYPVCYSPRLFSPALTVLEVYTGYYFNHDVDLAQWVQILSATPDLVCLRLVSFQHELYAGGRLGDVYTPTMRHDMLETLELTGEFVMLTDILTASTFPRLKKLLLDSNDSSARLVQRLDAITLAAPHIRKLSISSTSTGEWWKTAVGRLNDLEEITLFEMGIQPTIKNIRGLPRRTPPLTVRLERIWDLDSSKAEHLDLAISTNPKIILVDCVYGGDQGPSYRSQSESGSDHGSSYSDEVWSQYPSSDETSTDESERSYGESESGVMGTSV